MKVSVAPSGQARQSAETNQAPRSVLPAASASASSACTRAIAPAKSLSGPAQRAESTPGAPPNAATQKPESSASAGSPVAAQAATAFSRALPAKSGSVSSGSGR